MTIVCGLNVSDAIDDYFLRRRQHTDVVQDILQRELMVLRYVAFVYVFHVKNGYALVTAELLGLLSFDLFGIGEMVALHVHFVHLLQ